MLLLAVLAGLGAGALTLAAGENVPKAVLAGVAALAAAAHVADSLIGHE